MTVSSTTFRLDIPADIVDELTRIAHRRQMTVEELLRQAVKWEILLDAVEQQGGRLHIEREPGAELSMIVPDTKRVDQ